MKYNNAIACCAALAIALLGIATVNAEDVFVTNSKRINDITKAILSEIEKQQKEFEAEFKKANEPDGQNGMGMDPYMNPGMGPGMGAPGTEKAAPEPPKRFELDKEAIKVALRKRFRYDFDKSVQAGASGSVDTRNEIEIREEVIREMAYEGRSQAELLAEDRAQCEKEYPLYKPGTMVDISYAISSEPPRRYRGIFKRISPYRVQIGREIKNLSDMPEIIRCRFDEELNKKMRADYMKRRPITTKYNLERQTQIAARCKEVLEEQMRKNLRKGWVYINDAWKLPEDMLDDVLEFRKRAHKQQFTAPVQIDQPWALPGN